MTYPSFLIAFTQKCHRSVHNLPSESHLFRLKAGHSCTLGEKNKYINPFPILICGILESTLDIPDVSRLLCSAATHRVANVSSSNLVVAWNYFFFNFKLKILLKLIAHSEDRISHLNFPLSKTENLPFK